ncbi:hypothetical protein R1flu_013554 [Riccia fluitans]|uniref:Uncharacterized protein n=1 Tax=Riccia fluitans TaxID=41844 RepID=A0ABD1YDW2_9MARC
MFGVPMFGERGGGHHHENQPSPGFMGNFRPNMALDETLNTIKKTWDAASRVLAESCKLPSLAFKYQFTPGLLNISDIENLARIDPSVHVSLGDLGKRSELTVDAEESLSEILSKWERELFKLSSKGEKTSQEKHQLALDVTKRYIHSLPEVHFRRIRAPMPADSDDDDSYIPPNPYAELTQYLNIKMDFFEDHNQYDVEFMERAVLDHYAVLWQLDSASYSGAVLSGGQTEGMIYGVCDARDYLSGKVKRSIFDGDEVNVRIIAGQWEQAGNSDISPDLGSYYTRASSHTSFAKAGALAGIQAGNSDIGYRPPVASYVGAPGSQHYSWVKACTVAGIEAGNSDIGDRPPVASYVGAPGSHHYSWVKACTVAGIEAGNSNIEYRPPVACYVGAPGSHHYSWVKACTVAGIQTFQEVAVEENLPVPEGFDSWPNVVPCNEDGSMNVEILANLIGELVKVGHPILICMGNGSSAERACDDVQAAADLLLPIFKEHGLLNRTLTYTDLDGQVKTVKRNGFWFHVDLGVSDMHQEEFDFSLRGKKVFEECDFSDIQVINSIAMNEYEKRAGAVSTGIYLTRTKYQVVQTQNIATTLPKKLRGVNDLVEKGKLGPNLPHGSRDGDAPELVRYYITEHDTLDQIRIESLVKDLSESDRYNVFVGFDPKGHRDLE